MSVIWGEFTGGQISDVENVNLMKTIYNKKYSLDSVSTERTKSASFGMGIQYLFVGAENEKIWLDDDYMIALDGFFDNKDELAEELGLLICGKNEKNTAKTRDSVNVSELTAARAETKIGDSTKISACTNVGLVRKVIEKNGIGGLAHLRGSFAIAIYDVAQNIVYVATDPVASRCVYYIYRDGKFLFSTTLEPLLNVIEDVKINELYIKDYLLAPGLMPNVVPEETPYEGIYKIPSGTFVKADSHGISKEKYFSLEEMPQYNLKNAQDWGSEFVKLFEKCVCDILRYNDRNTGIALSSGLDSAGVAAFASKYLKEENKELYSYTYVPFEKNAKKTQRNDVIDETDDVRKIVSMHENIIPHFLNNEGRNCIEDLQKTIQIEEIPIKAVVNFPNLCEIYEKAHEDGCNIVLVGQMGNSTISNGYIDDILFDLWRNKKYFTFLKWLNNYSKNVKESRKAALLGCIRYFRYSQKVLKSEFELEVENNFLKSDIMNDYPAKERYHKAGIDVLQRTPGFEEMYRKSIMRESMLTYLGEFETKIGLANKVIIRDPTRDIRMISFCCRIPYRFFAYKGVPRWLVRGNLQKEIPNDLLDDWMRYGLQNADFVQRIRRDKDSVFQKIRELLSHNEIRRYINYEEVVRTLDKIDDYNDVDLENITMQLIFLCEIMLLLTNQGK